MNISLNQGIQLPTFDVEMLSIGKLIVVPYKQYIDEGTAFWLYPSKDIPLNMTYEEYYKPEYLDKAALSFFKAQQVPINMKTWGKVDFHWHLYQSDRELITTISQSTIWKQQALERILDENGIIRLLFLRVFRVPTPCIINSIPQPGNFYWAEENDQIFGDINSDCPAISEGSFKVRKHKIISGEPYPNRALEALNLEIYDNIGISPQLRKFSQNIESILGWSHEIIEQTIYPTWMTEITSLGNRSKEDDKGKSNYQAGTDFEEIVRRSLEFLGFKVDYAHRGGAGGLDLFCSEPYALVGECKSGKKIPNDTAVQLLNLGTLRLDDKKAFDESIKLIIGPGEATEQLTKAAKVHNMAIINPSTLEKLVQLHHHHPVDLLQLRDYLTNGKSDEEIDRFILKIRQEIGLRSHIVRLIKNYQENANSESADLSALHAIYVVSQPPQPLKPEEMHDILIELSSPLTGYLGRIKCDTWKGDRFYFLRDLIV